ncbi:MAG TPA: hypothetical protein VI544_02685 [Candidatus Nanoarchaeia archaeon]|nr:hypothetical protein [Candidatus Nanoarchaeia archaeon]
MKLKFYTNKEGRKVYTLKEKFDNEQTKDAHYKFVKVKNAPKS